MVCLYFRIAFCYGSLFVICPHTGFSLGGVSPAGGSPITVLLKRGGFSGNQTRFMSAQMVSGKISLGEFSQRKYLCYAARPRVNLYICEVFDETEPMCEM